MRDLPPNLARLGFGPRDLERLGHHAARRFPTANRADAAQAAAVGILEGAAAADLAHYSRREARSFAIRRGQWQVRTAAYRDRRWREVAPHRIDAPLLHGKAATVGDTVADVRTTPPGRELEARDLAEALDAALGDLPPADRDLIVGHLRDGRTLTELAAARGVSHQALSSRLKRLLPRARAAIRARYPRLAAEIEAIPKKRSPRIDSKPHRKGRATQDTTP